MIYIASDHASFALKKVLLEYLKANNHVAEDLGTYSEEKVDYPVFAKKLCTTILASKTSGEDIGILLCGTGIGMSIMANRFTGIRAALCTNEYMAGMARRHNDANVLCLGARVIGDDVAKGIVSVFLRETFEKGRHEKRVSHFDHE